MNIPVKVEGAAPGVLLSGGVLVLNKRKLRIKALPKNLPDFVIANISELQLGNKLYTSKLQSEDYTILHPDNTVVCQVRTSRNTMKLEAETPEETAEATESAEEATPEATAEN